MFFLISQLIKDIKNDIIIYGTGHYARDIYEKICNTPLEKKINGFVVTELRGKADFFGKPVYNISELSKYYHNETILVSVSKKYSEEIKNELLKNQFTQLLFLTDYEYKNFDLWENYRGKDTSEYIEYIQNWKWNFISSKNDNTYNVFRTVKNNSQIVFIIGMEMALPRNIKIMKALKKKGYDIVVLCYGDVSGIVGQKELSEYQIVIEQCGYIEELMYKMMKYNPLLYYIEPAWGDCSWADILIQQKDIFGKIVIDLYDVFNDGLVFATKEQKEMEQYALENADGIVWRWYAKEQLERQGFQFKGKSIQFLDYCIGGNDADIQSQQRISSETVKICFVCGHPNFLFEKYSEKSKGYAVHANIDDILKNIDNHDCCFHLFAWGLTEEAMKRCKLLESEYRRFKAFFGYEHQQILEMIKNYDYGCMLFTEGEDVPDNVSVDGRYFGTVLRDATCNKYFDYIDAGIPVIATLPQKVCDYLEGFGVLIKMNSSTLDIDFLRKNRICYKHKVKEVRYKLSVEHQISRLIEFFNDVVNEDSKNERLSV